MNTQEMLDAALGLAGLDKCPADAAVIVPGEGIEKVLCGIDMNTPELLVAKMMGYDCVVGHHPRNTDLKGMVDLFREQMYAMHEQGVPLNEAQKLIETGATKMADADHGFNFNRNASAAEVLRMPFVCIHTPADIIVEKGIQKLLDERFADKPRVKLKEIIDVLGEVDEYKRAIFPPKIAVGSPDSYAGKIHVVMSGVTGGGPDVYKAYFRAGVGTLVMMHASEEDIKAISEQKVGNLIVAGHMASDSYGMNRIIEVWERAGLKVTKMSGLL